MTVDIAELRRLLAEATPGTLVLVQTDSPLWSVFRGAKMVAGGNADDVSIARLVVALLNAAPELLARLEAAEREIARLLALLARGAQARFDEHDDFDIPTEDDTP